MAEIGLYIHVPFCLRRCAYCDFNTYAGLLPLRPAYVAALEQEAALWAEQHPGLKAITLYFGGGTPSLLKPEQVARLITAARALFALPPDAEVTLEANPGTVTEASLCALRAAGVNRLSLGVQSDDDSELQRLGRVHTWAQSVAAVAAARRAGFDNLSLDLLFGLPQQTMARWEETVARTLTLEPEHLSLYALTLEPETPLAQQIASGALPVPDPDLAADMYDLASERLLAAGFWHYELSNWAKGLTPAPDVWALPPGGVSEGIGPWVAHHNLIYWRTQRWLGLGAGAHSWLGERRGCNLLHPEAYIAALHGGNSIEVEGEEISGKLEMGETMMMGLRLAEGVTNAAFRTRFGVGLEDGYRSVLDRFSALGLLSWDGARVRLTAQGRLLGNQVFAEFLL